MSSVSRHYEKTIALCCRLGGVYGRDSCGFTAQARVGLSRQGIVFSYRSVDGAAMADGLHGKMEALGISTRRYDLPVVEVNGKLLLRPDMEQVLQIYRGG